MRSLLVSLILILSLQLCFSQWQPHRSLDASDTMRTAEQMGTQRFHYVSRQWLVC
ncbi:Tcte2 [Phodopus roborovskii]|uniref:Tcte2 protein n=1 Tax=Phodopus roborovskii TaxID=109678 RepID=A0AAV0A7U6_PHORO|nr:Tcte2 [Phodopus roborovskii]